MSSSNSSPASPPPSSPSLPPSSSSSDGNKVPVPSLPQHHRALLTTLALRTAEERMSRTMEVKKRISPIMMRMKGSLARIQQLEESLSRSHQPLAGGKQEEKQHKEDQQEGQQQQEQTEQSESSQEKAQQRGRTKDRLSRRRTTKNGGDNRNKENAEQDDEDKQNSASKQVVKSEPSSSSSAPSFVPGRSRVLLKKSMEMLKKKLQNLQRLEELLHTAEDRRQNLQHYFLQASLNRPSIALASSIRSNQELTRQVTTLERECERLEFKCSRVDDLHLKLATMTQKLKQKSKVEDQLEEMTARKVRLESDLQQRHSRLSEKSLQCEDLASQVEHMTKAYDDLLRNMKLQEERCDRLEGELKAARSLQKNRPRRTPRQCTLDSKASSDGSATEPSTESDSDSTSMYPSSCPAVTSGAVLISGLDSPCNSTAPNSPPRAIETTNSTDSSMVLSEKVLYMDEVAMNVPMPDHIDGRKQYGTGGLSPNDMIQSLMAKIGSLEKENSELVHSQQQTFENVQQLMNENKNQAAQIRRLERELSWRRKCKNCNRSANESKTSVAAVTLDGVPAKESKAVPETPKQTAKARAAVTPSPSKPVRVPAEKGGKQAEVEKQSESSSTSKTSIGFTKPATASKTTPSSMTEAKDVSSTTTSTKKVTKAVAETKATEGKGSSSNDSTTKTSGPLSFFQYILAPDAQQLRKMMDGSETTETKAQQVSKGLASSSSSPTTTTTPGKKKQSKSKKSSKTTFVPTTSATTTKSSSG